MFREKRDREDRDKTLEDKDLKNSQGLKRDRDDVIETHPVSYKSLSGVQKNVIQFCSIPRSAREILEHVGYAYNSTNIAGVG